MSEELKLIPPTDPRVLSMIAPFTDEALKEHNFKDRKELTDAMFMAMKRYGGIGLSANQVGLPYRMFVAGGHLQIENGLSIAMYNPEIVSVSDEVISFKEGCLSFPDLYLMIKRPKVCELKYQDVEGNEKVLLLEGLAARCVQHELDHLNGVLFVQRASRLKLERALKSRPKERQKRLEYEQRRAIAEHLKKLSEEKGESSESTGSTDTDSIPERESKSA